MNPDAVATPLLLAEYLNLCDAISAMAKDDPGLDAAMDAGDRLWEQLTSDERAVANEKATRPVPA